MSLAADARAAVRERPFLYEALRAGIVNYTAAARLLDVADEEAAVATALRRYAERLPGRTVTSRDVNVTMHGGLVSASDVEGLLTVDGQGFSVDDGSLTGVLATGEVDSVALGHVLGQLIAAGIEPIASGVADGSMCVIVERRDGPTVLRTVETALEAVPDPTV